MERLTCSYCGLPFRAPLRPPADTAVYCCSGCAMAQQLGIDGARFPVTPQLVFDLAGGFGLFNQGLLFALGAALAGEGRPAGAALCLLLSVAIGALLYPAALVWQWRGGWLRGSDAVAFALAAGPLAGGVALAAVTRGAPGPALALAANLALAVWSARGFVRRWWARRW